MTTPPTFVSGAILTAAQMNSIGLWQTSNTTVGSAVSSHAVTSCFSTDWMNYKLVISGLTATVNSSVLYLKLSGTTGSTYYGNMIYNAPTVSAIGGVSAANASALGLFICTMSDSGVISLETTIGSPFLATGTNAFGNYAGRSYNGQCSAHDSNAASSTGFTILPSSGTISAGTVKVYGYN